MSMRRFLSVFIVFGLLLAFSSEVWAGQSRSQSRAGVNSGKFVAGGLLVRPMPAQWYWYSVYPYVPYSPYPYPVVVVSPYLPPYYVQPAVVATLPYFCLFHNEGYVSRIGLLDHLAGAHKIPLDAAAAFCPDDTGACLFPGY